MQPIGLEDLLVLIRQSLLENGPVGCHDLGSHEIMTYRELMERATEHFDGPALILGATFCTQILHSPQSYTF